MTDLVQKLRSTADGDCREVARDMCFQSQDGLEWADLMDRAADEIERLREENRRVISDRPYIVGFNAGWDAALEQHGKRFDQNSK
jgi:uncharacterized Rossmann fold enzyme